MNNNKTKNIILAVLVIGLVGMTIAYASLTQTLTINNNQATVSSNWRVRFNGTVTTSVGTTISGTTTGATFTSGTPTVTNDKQTITGLQATFTKPGDYVEVAFKVQNEGNIAAKGSSVTLNLGNLTCAPGSGSSVSQEAANTFCTKLVKWVKHSDRTTDWSSADTLAAYSGSGDYPSIDGILRIEYPSTLSNSDIAAISGGSVVVTLGDTTLHFEQDDNVTAQSGGNNQTYTYADYDIWSSSNEISGTTLDSNWQEFLRKNTSTNVVETCGVFGSGQNGTVCITNNSNGYNSDFEDVTGDTYDITTIEGLEAKGLKGYSLAKAEEMLNKGASDCDVSIYSVNCDIPSGGGCNILRSGDVDCYGGGSRCYIGNDGYYGCE